MISKINVIKQGEFGLLVEGLELLPGSQYQYLTGEDPSTSFRSFRWEDTVTINSLYYINSLGEESLVDKEIIEHKKGVEIDQNTFILNDDGHYLISHVIIPTLTWVEAMEALGDMSPLDLYEAIVYYDGVSNKFYNWDTEGHKEITVEELNKIDPEDTIKLEGKPAKANTVIKPEYSTGVFYTPHLDKCFNGLIKSLLKDIHGNVKCPNASLVAKERERDLIWMFINAIGYEKRAKRYHEAQRLLERLNRCNSICKKADSFNNYTPCGC